MDKLFILCAIFFTLDLIIVGTTCIHVIILVRKILKGNSNVHVDKRDFIKKGE